MNRDHERLRDILEYAERIRRHTAPGRGVLDDEVVAAAVTRWMEVIGEAAGAVSADLRADYPEVGWPDLVGMRNVLAHAYRRVNLDLVWACRRALAPDRASGRRHPRPRRAAGMTTTAGGQPRWHPISALGLIGSVIDEGLAGAEGQYGLLLEAKHGPFILDDHTVERVVRVFGDTHDDLWVFEEQLARWSKAPLSARQRAEVDRLILQQRRMRDVVEDILALAEALRRTTIEAVLAKSDFDLGLEAVFGGRIVAPRPDPPPPSARAREVARTQRLALPEGVSLAKGFQLSGTPYYAITHTVLGAVGRIVVRPTDAGQTRSMRRWRGRRPIPRSAVAATWWARSSRSWSV